MKKNIIEFLKVIVFILLIPFAFISFYICEKGNMLEDILYKIYAWVLKD